MKIKDYRLFLESKISIGEKHTIDYICKKYDIKNYTINDDGTVDVDGDVNLNYSGLTKLPLKFGKVTGYFTCADNKINSLEGSPYWVGGYFTCSYNNIKSLKGCPKYIGGSFSCSYNQLKTLEGGPETVLLDYYCRNNQLINFKGFPDDFDRYSNFDGNIINNILTNIPSDKENKFIYWCNEFDAIDDNGEVIPERMEEVYNKLGLEYNED